MKLNLTNKPPTSYGKGLGSLAELRLEEAFADPPVLITNGQGFCNCATGHKDQHTRYPVGAKVKATDDVPQCEGDSVPVGTIGIVTGHCDDGRAWFRFDHEPQQGHTFHFPEQWVNTIATVINIPPRTRTADTLRELDDAAMECVYTHLTHCKELWDQVSDHDGLAKEWGKVVRGVIDKLIDEKLTTFEQTKENETR
jgi:hypothetical protein